MKMVSCDAAPVARVILVAGSVESEGRMTVVWEKQEDGRFGFSVPKRVGKNIRPGDTLDILCVPTINLILSQETMVLAKRENGITSVLFSQGDYWTELWRKIQ